MKKAICTLLLSLMFVTMMSNTVSAVKYKLHVTKYGTCRVTAYDSSDGSIGASGNELTPNKSCAASREIPLGTRLYVKDFGIVTVEDRMAEWYEDEYDGKVLDLYLEDYEASCEWGVKELEVYIIKSMEQVIE